MTRCGPRVAGHLTSFLHISFVCYYLSLESWRGDESCVDLTDLIPLQVKSMSSDLKARLGHRHVAVDFIGGGGGDSGC